GVTAGQTATIAANAASGSASMTLALLAPPPIVTVSGSTLSTSSSVSVHSGQAVSVAFTESQGDNWTSTDDYLEVFLTPANCYIQYQPVTSTVYLQNDGTGWLSGTLDAGSTQVLTNGQCSVSLNGSAYRHGPNLTVTV